MKIQIGALLLALILAGCAVPDGGAPVEVVSDVPTETPTEVPIIAYELLSERNTDRDVLVDSNVGREEIVALAEYFRDEKYPKGRMQVRIFNTREGWEAKQLCIKAFNNWPITNANRPPACITSDHLDSEIGGVFRKSSSGIGTIYYQGD